MQVFVLYKLPTSEKPSKIPGMDESSTLVTIGRENDSRNSN
jgi:hypothetical protein